MFLEIEALPSNSLRGVCLWETSVFKRCLSLRGVCLWEVSVFERHLSSRVVRCLSLRVVRCLSLRCMSVYTYFCCLSVSYYRYCRRSLGEVLLKNSSRYFWPNIWNLMSNLSYFTYLYPSFINSIFDSLNNYYIKF